MEGFPKSGHIYMYVCLFKCRCKTSAYRRLWLISACAYSGKRNDSMRLRKDMCLYGT